MVDLTAAQRKFFSKVELDWECWIWTGYHEGKVPRFNKPVAVRWILKELCGIEVSRSEVVSMLCGRTSCVNPDHAKVWPRSEMVKSRPRVKSDTCRRGHKVDLEVRGCKTCRDDRYKLNPDKIKDRSAERRKANSSRDTPRVEIYEKQCPSCTKVKPAESFYSDRTRDDWLTPYCKDCTSGRHKDYRTKNESAVKERKRAYASTSTGRSLKRSAEARRNARLKSLGPMRGDIDLLFTIAYGEMCVKCNHQEWSHVDHIVPASVAGSSNSVENLQPLCPHCNIGKGNRESVDYRPFVMTDELADAILGLR